MPAGSASRGWPEPASPLTHEPAARLADRYVSVTLWDALVGGAAWASPQGGTRGRIPLARVRIDPHWHYHDIRALVLENEHLRLIVLPEIGAKIHALIDKKLDYDVLWHNPRLELRRPVFGQNFDDWWSGGWDEVFPTCDVSTYQGETYPYLGELWSLPWTWEIAAERPDGVSLYLTRTTVIATARMERWISLDGDAPVVRFRHRLTNVGVQPMDFVWGIHPHRR